MRVRTHTNPHSYHERLDLLNLSDIFSNPNRPLDMEIGFGRGVFLKERAYENPNRNLIGVEVRKPLVDTLKKELSNTSTDNVHLIHGNGEIVLEDCINDNSLSSLFLFHPDPWFKKRHHKRRVVNNRFIPQLIRKLVQGGSIYISTDVPSLHHYMESLLDQEKSLKKVHDDDFWREKYKTHWSEFSIEDKRDLNFLKYSKI